MHNKKPVKPEDDQDAIVLVSNIPETETYITHQNLHHRVQDWEERVRRTSRYDLIIAITEGAFVSILMRQADAPHANNFQKLIAIWLIIHRIAITSLFQNQMSKILTKDFRKACKKAADIDYLSIFLEGSAILTAIAFQQSIGHFNRGSMMTYTIFPIMGIEFLSISFRIISRIVLSNEAKAMVPAHEDALRKAPNK